MYPPCIALRSVYAAAAAAGEPTIVVGQIRNPAEEAAIEEEGRTNVAASC